MINKDELKNALKLYLVTDSDILKGRDFYKLLSVVLIVVELKKVRK